MRTKTLRERCSSLPALLVVALAVAVDASAISSAGAVSIGLSTVRAQRFVHEPIGSLLADAGDEFASSLAVGDFNGDGADDLATGVPLDDGPREAPVADVGAVVVRYGIPGEGLTPASARTLVNPFVPGMPYLPHVGQRFGFALAAGDLNLDGRDDLVVGVPGYPEGYPLSSGAVLIYFGGSGGLSTFPGRFLRWGLGGMGNTNYGDPHRFGAALATGDWNGDGRTDLVVGSPGDDIDLAVSVIAIEAGTASLFLTSAAGGTMSHTLLFQDGNGVPDDSQDGDHFGAAVAFVRLDGDACADLAVGVPGENGDGAMNLFYGAGDAALPGCDGAQQFFSQGTLGEVSEAGDLFGAALAGGDVDGDGYGDLVVGSPGEDAGSGILAALATGMVTVLYGGSAGVNLPRTLNLLQSDIHGVSAVDQSGDNFGAALASADFDGDARADLAIAHPGEGSGGNRRGAVTVIAGGAAGLSTRFSQLGAGINGVPGAIQEGREFGAALATGDFDGDGYGDLAAGAPLFDAPEQTDAGEEVVLSGALFADGFEGGHPGAWSATAL